MKRAAKPARATADALFSKIVRARDGWCQRCGRPDQLQCAHIVSRRYHATRWSEDNAIALCAGDHKYFTEHPLEWEVWISGHIGVAALSGLKLRAMSGLTQRTNYRALCASLRERLDELEVARENAS